MRKLIAAVLLLLAACNSGPPREATGAEIYAQLCSACHMPDLSGGIGPPLGPGSNAAQQPDEFLEVTIMRGRGRMPSFSATLDDDQLRRLIEHIREQQR